ncbi:MAG: hypothetical protein KatS3mg103_0173 [Phycisphaerales bacterium]|nr:MAG: hypothetical protein KatS3mg103_0173 [Phycisphaerales bacterium]
MGLHGRLVDRDQGALAGGGPAGSGCSVGRAIGRSFGRSYPAWPWACGVLLGVAVVAGGCREPLITDNQLRSPFHRYDRVRNQDADTFVRDEFGRARPNVAARLAPQ